MKTKKIILITFLLISSMFLTSCWNDKKIETKKTNSNIVEDVKTEKIKEDKKTNYKDLTKKENESGRFQKIEEGNEIKTIETKVWNESIWDINISPNGWWTVKGWIDTGADPLELKK